ncbi:MAG TPA: caspase family protein [Ohtaekwangia sp.]|nr:caspase family protein [Ohtaekwangia sp.]
MKAVLSLRRMLQILVVGLLFISVRPAAQAQSPKLIIDSKGHTGLVNELVFLDGGRKLLSAGNDKTIRLWDVNNGTLLRTLFINQTEGYHGRIYAAAITADEKTLAIGGFFGRAGSDSLAIGSIFLISLDKPSDIRILRGHTNIITDLAITGDKLISASADKKVKVWSINDVQPKVLRTFNNHRSPISRMALTQNSKRIASADISGNVVVWNFDSGEVITDKIGKFHEGAITSIAFSQDERMLFTGGDDGKIIKWTTDGKFLETLVEESKTINAMLPIKGKDQLLYLNTGGKIKSLSSGVDLLLFSAHNNTVSAVAMAPFSTFAGQKGSYVATAGGDEKEIFIWNTIDGTVVRKLGGHGHGIFATAKSDDNTTIGFGQTNPTGILEDAPIEKTFNLNTFSLQDAQKNHKLIQFDRDYLGSEIYKKSALMLTHGTGHISIDPQKDGEIRSYTFLNDHNVISVGSTFGIPLFERTGKFITRLIGHHGEVWSVCPLGNDLLISSSADQTIKIWNYKNKELLLTFFIANDREWVLWSPSGYYHASAGGEKYIGWLVNKKENQLSEFHEVSQFREKYHRPDVIKAIIKEQSLEHAAKTLNMTIPSGDEIIKLLPPKISWIAPVSYTETTSEKSYTIRAFIESNNSLKAVKLMVNGRPYATKLEEFKTEKNDKGMFVNFTLDFTKIGFQSRGLEVVPASEVDIQKKDITIQFFAENEVANILTDARTISWTPQEHRDSPTNNNNTASTTNIENTSSVALPNLYIATIGISSFQNPAYNLNYADDDAQAIERVFKDQQGKLFNKIYSFQHINENATRAKILTTFERLNQVVTPKDFVVIFIATHGLNKDNQFFILPHDGDASKSNVTCINWRDFSSAVGNLPSQVLLLIDACHSGQLGKNMGQVTMDNTEAVRELASSEYGVVIMAASTGSEYSLEHADWSHGAFTLSLIEGLEKRKADIRPDGTIYLRELDFYVAERVKQLTENRQHPTTQKPSSISTMPVVKY